MQSDEEKRLEYWPKTNKGWTVVKRDLQVDPSSGVALERIERVRTFGMLKRAFDRGFLSELFKLAAEKKKEDEKPKMKIPMWKSVAAGGLLGGMSAGVASPFTYWKARAGGKGHPEAWKTTAIGVGEKAMLGIPLGMITGGTAHKLMEARLLPRGKNYQSLKEED